jgi:predicted NUDIX family NTP pyrophosphohydrolase
VSNTFTMEWPPGSGRSAEFPEMDRFMWAGPDVARRKLNKAQMAFVSRLLADIDP